MIKRIAALFCAVLLLLSGCTAAPNSSEAAQSEPPDGKLTLKLALLPGISQAALLGINLFCEKVSSLSGGEISVEVSESDDILQALSDGSDMAFGSNAEFVRANGNFNSYTSPFFFRDYNHLTLTLNSQDFFNIIRESNVSLTGAMPLAAFYDGNSYFVSTRGQYLDTVDQFDGSTVNILEDENAAIFSETLEGFGADVKERSAEYLLVNIGRNRDRAIMECDTTALTELEFSERVQSFVVCRSFHRARVNWLMLSESTREALSEKQLAVLKEAVAYALAANDEYVLALEEEGERYLDDLGASFTTINYGEFCTAADEVIANSTAYNVFWDQQQHEAVRALALS